jgi:hypothetical protein
VRAECVRESGRKGGQCTCKVANREKRGEKEKNECAREKARVEECGSEKERESEWEGESSKCSKKKTHLVEENSPSRSATWTSRLALCHGSATTHSERILSSSPAEIERRGWCRGSSQTWGHWFGYICTQRFAPLWHRVRGQGRMHSCQQHRPSRKQHRQAESFLCHTDLSAQS